MVPNSRIKLQSTNDKWFILPQDYAEFIISMAYLFIQHSFSMVFSYKEIWKQKKNIKT